MPYQISFHYDGNIVDNHKVTARTLGKTLSHLQRAVDRAFLQEKYGAVEKNTRMRSGDFEAADFIALNPRDGGFILDLVKESATAGRICDIMMNALDSAYDEVIEQENEDQEENNEERAIADQIENRRALVRGAQVSTYDFLELENAQDQFVLRSYASRLICREFDQILAIIRAHSSGESTFDLNVNGTRSRLYEFDRERSQRFHRIISKRHLGPETLYRGYIREMDVDHLSGRFWNHDTEKKHIIYFSSQEAFDEAKNSLGEEGPLHQFYGCPYLEYDAYDLQAGDIYYLTVRQDD